MKTFVRKNPTLRDVAVTLGDVANLVVGLAKDMKVVKKDMVGLKADVKVMKTDVAVLKTDVAVLKSDVAVLKTDVAGLKTDVSVLKADVAGLKTDVSVLKTDMVGVKKELSKVTATLVEHGERMDTFATKDDLTSMKNELMVHIDGFARNQRTFDTELTSMSAGNARRDRRIDRVEKHTGLSPLAA